MPPLDRPDDVLDQTEPLSSGARLGWWGGYAFLVLVAFCFGVWAGNQRPKPAEVVAAPAVAPGEKAASVEPTPKKELPPEPKKAPEVVTPEPKKAPEVVVPEPKKAPEPMPEVKKTPEVKKAPEPKAPAVKEVLFVKEVFPIFKAKCTICHGDSKGVKGGIDLRTVAAITKGGDGGIGIKAGDPKAGTVWESIESGAMPPAGKEALTDAEKLVIHNWILSGAK